ncbi:FecR domain-containing protein, partial [Novosphingobium sp. 1949]
GLVAAGLGAHWLVRREAPAPRLIASATGQRRSLALPDGSQLILDAASRVALDFTPERRTVHLERGAAHFDVAHDPARPFEVFTPQARMEALGTRFSVDRLSRASELRVYQGRVALALRDGPAGFAAPRTLPAREWVLIGDRALLGRGRFDPASGADWQNDWLDAQAMPLGQALERLGRYTPLALQLADPADAARTFSGRFRLDHPERSLALIGALFALRLEHRTNALVLVPEAPAARA